MNEQTGRRGEYEVRLPLFEGPLDLLLYVVTKSEVPIEQIVVSDVTRQYLEYLDMMRDLNIILASEYLNMAATLLRLKAQEVLPSQDPEELEGDEDLIVNREQLIAKLLEYRKYKEAAGSLKLFESEHIGCYGRGLHEDVEIMESSEEMMIGDITFFDLVKAFRNVLERANSEEPFKGHVIRADVIRLDDRIERVLGMVDEREEVPFEDIFDGNFSRSMVVVCFQALLELVKMKMITFRQEEHGTMIFIRKRTDGARYEGPAETTFE